MAEGESDHLEFEIDLSKLCVVSTENCVLYQPEVKVFFNDHLQKTEDWIRTRNSFDIPVGTVYSEPVGTVYSKYGDPEGACGSANVKRIKTISQVIQDLELANKQRVERQRNTEEQEVGKFLEHEGGETNSVLIGDKFYELDHVRSVIKTYLEVKHDTEIAPPIHRQLIRSKSLNGLCKPSVAKLSRRSVSLGDLRNYQGARSANFLSWMRHLVTEPPRRIFLPNYSTTDNSKEKTASLWNEFDEVHPVYSSESVSSGDSGGGQFEFLTIKDGYASLTIGTLPETSNADSKPKSLRRRFLGALRRVFRCFSCCRKPECDN